MGGALNFLVVLGTVADLVAIGLFIYQTVNRDNVKNILLKIILISLLFLVTASLYVVSDSYNTQSGIDIFMTASGYLYIVVGCFGVVIMMYKFFKAPFEVIEFIFGMIITVLPFVMGIILFIIVDSNINYISYGLISVSILQLFFMLKNYLINTEKVISDIKDLKWYSGKTQLDGIDYKEVVLELFLVIIPFSFGITLTVLSNSKYLENVKDAISNFSEIF